jgi:AraC-like DNA-binding protein
MMDRMSAPGSEVANEHAWHVPAPGLRQLVDACIGYRQAAWDPARHRGLPSPGLTLIFTLDEPLVLATHPDPAQPPGSYEAVLSGLHTSPVTVVMDRPQAGIQLSLSPLGTRTLLGMPASELAGLDVPASDVLGGPAVELLDRLRCATGWADRFGILDQGLLALSGHGRSSAEVSSEVSYAWRKLLRTGGTARVTELAAETGWSDRHLRARFRAETGLGPKAAARVIRFTRARTELARRAAAGCPLDLAGLAVACGYFDQAHLDREFGQFAGCSPTTWLAEEFQTIHATAA